MSTDDFGGFTTVTKGKKKVPITLFKTPEGYGNEALRVIGEGDFSSAINYLTRGMNLDRTDHRHHINRSYCFLRIGEYKQALDDIRYAIEHLTDTSELSRAKCREGQALRGLKDYEAAENAFRQSINFAPDFLFPKRELKRTQIMRIVDMGFPERDAILALERKPDTMDAIVLLSDESLTNSAIHERRECPSDDGDDDDDDDDEIFCSDSEENPSNERLLCKILNYNSSLPENLYVSPPTAIPESLRRNTDKVVRTPSQDRSLRICKATSAAAKPKSNQGINEMAIWVGNVQSPITETMLKTCFSKFGKVASVFWNPANPYCFVNFKDASSSRKVLDSTSFGNGIEIKGIKLFIKPATVNATK